MIRFLAALLILASSAVHAQSPLLTDLPLSYLEQTDGQSRNKPLIIFLHGSGANEADLFDIKDQLPTEYTFLSARAPLEVGPGSYQWFNKKPGDGPYDGETDDLRNSEALISDFVAKATEKYHTQPDKVFLIGFSQGAIMSYEVALRHPDILRGFAALSGKILPMLKSELQPLPGFKALDVFIGHGTADQRVPYVGATDAETWLKELGITPESHAYLGIGHTISDNEIMDLDSWLKEINHI
ncbi:phospholipase [Pseudomonas sp. 10B1]|uniref:alpha/beta hydrolase n=1 Tax=unclassified Pseudomonas TaxID=196821 RepID=UPI002AB37AFC|nr:MULTISPECIES: phospholipase [unclassified Pseudomonas]MDY7559542.1 phospholipase [Pseudomonas sp. AB6]MEA9977549.1 phospholipase [Pseudomonas sp. RTS4]MEA9996396.1 phospholipase [Pseudomonas sp. AA4]MEB0088101.1 phospholipase [Pseudomonas sp. RTI1]MEB0126928.1 phospholipase [Pseudomonas sp. CCC1.2]